MSLTDPVSLGVAGAALLFGTAAAWFATPAPPEIDARRLFKAVLAARAPGLDVFDHPWERVLEQKLLRPASAVLPGGPSPEERALLDRLAALPDPAARLALLRTEDGAPGPLPEVATARRWLGPAFDGREAEDATAEEAERRLHLAWVYVAGPPVEPAPDLRPAFATFARVVDPRAGLAQDAVGDALFGLAAAIGSLAPLPWWAVELVETWLRIATALARHAVETHVAAALKEAVPPGRAGRLVVAVGGDAAPLVLRVLEAEIALRDRVVAVVAAGAAVGGVDGLPGPLGAREQQAWLDANFRHELLDVEVIRRIPYVSVGFLGPDLDAPGLPGILLAAQRFPEPGYVDREPEIIEPFDLGTLLVPTELPAGAIVGALRVTVDLLVLSRR